MEVFLCKDFLSKKKEDGSGKIIILPLCNIIEVYIFMKSNLF